MVNNYKVSLLEGQDLTHKWLPVSRPKNQVLVQFTQRELVDDKTEKKGKNSKMGNQIYFKIAGKKKN
jgi:hypothetical protein